MKQISKEKKDSYFHLFFTRMLLSLIVLLDSSYTASSLVFSKQ